MLVETLRTGRVVIDELDPEVDSGADAIYGFHIETAESRRAWDRKWMAPESEASLVLAARMPTPRQSDNDRRVERMFKRWGWTERPGRNAPAP